MKLAQSLLKEELKHFDTLFNKESTSNYRLLDKILKFIIRRKGKQMRPLFVLLSSKIANEINDSTYRAASLIELLHTATLVHDDVVDDANMRRGFLSINAVWKNKVAVLVGDYLLARGLIQALEHKEYRILEIVSNAVKEMSEGELLQIEKARKLDIKEDIYFDIIRAKTASLLASSCSAGAFAATKDEAIADQFRQFGEYLGISFQIKDDLLDFGKDDIGKPVGGDIKEKKMTLPLIYTLNVVDQKTKEDIIYKIKKKSTDKKVVNYIIDIVRNNGGLEYAAQQMDIYKQKALEILYTFPDTPYRKAMEELVEYVTDRKK